MKLFADEEAIETLQKAPGNRPLSCSVKLFADEEAIETVHTLAGSVVASFL